MYIIALIHPRDKINFTRNYLGKRIGNSWLFLLLPKRLRIFIHSQETDCWESKKIPARALLCSFMQFPGGTREYSKILWNAIKQQEITISNLFLFLSSSFPNSSFFVFNRVDKEEDPVKKNVAENLRHKKTLKTIAKCMQKFTKLQLHLNNLSWSLSIRNQSAEKKGTQQESLILTIMDEELCGAIISKEVKSSGQNNCIFFIHSHFFSFTWESSFGQIISARTKRLTELEK